VRQTRIVVDRMAVGADAFEPSEITYADVFVVVREGATVNADSDWEVTLRTVHHREISPGRHQLVLQAADGSTLRGAAVLRFSDGHRHLFRGDEHLDGLLDERPPPRT
jgi:hypothetical protein